MNDKIVLAFDIGTGSGRGILGYYSDESGLEKIEEVYRFENGFIRINDGLYWDYMHIYREMLKCLKNCKENGIRIDSIGIDTWAQDYAYLGPSGELIGYPRAYRDPIFDEMGIRTATRLEFDKTLRPAERETADCFLFMANIFIQMLTGEAVYDESLTSIGRVDITKESLVPRKVDVGDIIGYTGKAVFDETGYNHIPVACALAHDTSCAAYSVPVRENFLWISSGSYGMYGVVSNGELISQKDALSIGFSNTVLDGNRICTMAGSGSGMYHIQQCMKKWKADGLSITYPQLTAYAVSHRTDKTFDFAKLDDTTTDFPAEINRALAESGYEPAGTPEELYETFCNALAKEYSERVLRLESKLTEKFEKIYIIGGGSQADGVNIRIAEMTGKEIYEGIIEASAIGNVLAQLKAICGKDITTGKLLEMRKL